MKIARAGRAEIIVFLSLNLQVREVFVAVAVAVAPCCSSNHADDGDKKSHNFTYLIMKNSSFARFARANFIFVHLTSVLVLSTA